MSGFFRVVVFGFLFSVAASWSYAAPVYSTTFTIDDSDSYFGGETFTAEWKIDTSVIPLDFGADWHWYEDALVDFSLTKNGVSANGTGTFNLYPLSHESYFEFRFDEATSSNFGPKLLNFDFQVFHEAPFIFGEDPTQGLDPNYDMIAALIYETDSGERGVGRATVHDFSSYDTISTVPLPAALPLYGAGMALLGFVGWRRKAY